MSIHGAGACSFLRSSIVAALIPIHCPPLSCQIRIKVLYPIIRWSLPPQDRGDLVLASPDAAARPAPRLWLLCPPPPPPPPRRAARRDRSIIHVRRTGAAPHRGYQRRRCKQPHAVTSTATAARHGERDPHLLGDGSVVGVPGPGDAAASAWWLLVLVHRYPWA